MSSRLFNRRSAGLTASFALLGTVVACSGDDTTQVVYVDAACSTSSGTSSGSSTAHADGGSSSSSTTTSSSSTTSSAVADAAPDSETDATTDAGGPPALNICSQLDSIFNVSPDLRGGDFDWPTTIILGESSDLPFDAGNRTNTFIGWDGFQNLVSVDCNLYAFYNASVNSTTGPDTGGAEWANNIRAWEERLFGCPVHPDAGADAGLSEGYGFALVPPEFYGQQLSTADLQRLGDTFVEAVIQAVTNQVNDPRSASYTPIPTPLLTAGEIDALQQAVAHEETKYPSIIPTTRFTQSTCPDSGAGDGGNVDGGNLDGGDGG